ncbi:MAG: hypothetical protein ABI583_03995 [Betaproteobacteria bacterium]
MNTLKKWMLIAAMSFCASSFANTFTADLSDLWFNESEAGWGVNVTHQREVIFLTFFIYGPTGKATWYTGQAALSGQNSQGAATYTGTMYEFTGPYFANFFNPAAVSGRSVGTVTFTAFLDLATISYTIDGISVTKVVTRQTFRANDLSGQYVGAMKQVQSGCTGQAFNGDFNNVTEFSIAHNDKSLIMTARQPDGTVCSYDGSYTQNGRVGRAQGNYSCPGGLSGTYDILEIESNLHGFTARYVANNNVCSSVSGRIGAMRK